MKDIPEMMCQEIETGCREVFGIYLFEQIWTKMTDMNIL
jgi:hypothetical protein